MGAGALKLNSEQIRQVQMMLIEKGFDIGGQPDGVLGPRTKQAMIAFQRQQGFQTTGQIDTQTFSALGLSNLTGQQGTVGAGQMKGYLEAPRGESCREVTGKLRSPGRPPAETFSVC
jgi:peptidoglycan hydrolase-like protein with peptidoglycan-binding domain